MGRPGVTFTEVDEAARYLQGKGVNLTVDAIRARLGTGSRTTLTEHLKRWKALQADGEGKLPEPLLALITGLWESLQSQAEKRVQDYQAIAQQEISALKTQLQATSQSESILRHELHQLHETIDLIQREKSALVLQIQSLEKSQDKLDTLYQITLKQLDDTQQESQRLHKLAMQLQANLEHYQLSIQQQQVEQNLAKETQQAVYAQEIAALKRELDKVRERYGESEKARGIEQSQLQQMQVTHNQLTCQHEKLLATHRDIEHQLAQSQTGEILIQKQLDKVEQVLLTERQLTQSLHQQVAVLREQAQHAQADLCQHEDKIEALRHEKMFLVQEKAQLEGAFKQLNANLHPHGLER